MSKLTALVEAAAQTASEPNSKPLRENFFTLASPATILELCALLEKAEEALVEYVGVVCSHNDPESFEPKVIDGGYSARQALTAIKQWKEMK